MALKVGDKVKWKTSTIKVLSNLASADDPEKPTHPLSDIVAIVVYVSPDNVRVELPDGRTSSYWLEGDFDLAPKRTRNLPEWW
jgi:hypothetical protein